MVPLAATMTTTIPSLSLWMSSSSGAFRLRGDGMVTAAAGWQRGGKDRGSGRYSPAMVGRGSKIKVLF